MLIGNYLYQTRIQRRFKRVAATSASAPTSSSSADCTEANLGIGNNSRMNWIDDVKWDEKGLIPVIAQEIGTNDVLMFAWMNREALLATAETGRAVYFRSEERRVGKECGI